MNVKRIKSAVIATMALFMLPCTLNVTAINFVSINKNENIKYTDSSLCVANSMMVSADEENSKSLVKFSPNGLLRTTESSNIPQSVDLSDNLEIGCDGDMNISAAIATTKYQFNYEVDRLNGNVSNSKYNFASVYNYVCGGNNNSVSLYECYDVLKNFGAIRCSNSYPEVNVSNYYDYNIPQNDIDKIEALNTRIEYHYVQPVGGIGTPITNPTSDYNLTTIKRLISQGNMPVVEMQISHSNSQQYYSYKKAKSNPNETAIYRIAIPNTSQNLCTVAAVVGYNDNVTCDINGNGLIESYERGAFKIALTWGNNEINNGYVWVMYDALNQKSASSTNTWENNLPQNRIPAFRGKDWNENRFYFIKVKKYTPALIGKLQMNTKSLSKLKLSSFKNSSSAFNSSECNVIFSGKYKPLSSVGNGVVRNIMFDYDNLVEPLGDLSVGNYFGVKIENKMDGHSTLTLNNLKFSLIDNFNTNVAVLTNLQSTIPNNSNQVVSKKINLKLGDMNYDNNITETDVDIMTDYMLQEIELSNLQYYVGDIDQDGYVELADLIMMKKSLDSAKARNKVDTFVRFYQNDDLAIYQKLSPEEKYMEYDDIMNIPQIQKELRYENN